MRISDWSSDVCSSDLPLPIAPLWRRVGEVDHDPRLACDPMKAFEGSIDDVYQSLEKDSSMPASIAAASSAAAMGERGSRSDITRPIASLWTGSTMSMETLYGGGGGTCKKRGSGKQAGGKGR